MHAFFYNMYVQDSFGVTLNAEQYPAYSDTNALFQMQDTFAFVMVHSRITYTLLNPYWGVNPLSFDRYFEFWSRARSRLSGYLNVASSTWEGDINEQGVIKLENIKNNDAKILNSTLVQNDDGSYTNLWDMIKDTLEIRELVMEDNTNFTSFIQNSTFD